MFFCNIYNFRRICPIYQIHTKDVASCIYQLFHLVILRALRSGSIFNCHSRLNSILVEMIKFFFKIMQENYQLLLFFLNSACIP